MTADELAALEERVERVRMAFAEAGYPDVQVWASWGDTVASDYSAPPEVRWRGVVIGLSGDCECWPCWIQWENGTGCPDCDHDPLTSPWPEVVR